MSRGALQNSPQNTCKAHTRDSRAHFSCFGKAFRNSNSLFLVFLQKIADDAPTFNRLQKTVKAVSIKEFYTVSTGFSTGNTLKALKRTAFPFLEKTASLTAFSFHPSPYFMLLAFFSFHQAIFCHFPQEARFHPLSTFKVNSEKPPLPCLHKGESGYFCSHYCTYNCVLVCTNDAEPRSVFQAVNGRRNSAAA